MPTYSLPEMYSYDIHVHEQAAFRAAHMQIAHIHVYMCAGLLHVQDLC